MADADLIPAGVIGMWAFCPRRMWLEWVDGEAGEGSRLRDGRLVAASRRASLPEPGAVDALSVDGVFASAGGVSATFDRVELDGEAARPVVEAGVAMVEIGAMARVLRGVGYRVERARQGQREIELSTVLDAEVEAQLTAIREAIGRGERPPPLVQSTKCLRCALAPACQPNELAALRDQASAPGVIAPSVEAGVPLHVNLQGAVIGLRGDELEVRARKTVRARSRLEETASVSVYGNVMFTTQALRRLMSRQVPVAFHSQSGWLDGMARGLGGAGLAARRAQYRRADNAHDGLQIARRCVRAKVRHQRLLLRRNHPDAPDGLLAALAAIGRRVSTAETLDVLRGHEGDAARRYFGVFGALLRPPGGADPAFAWQGRKRRPPPDLPNALLSFCYALLVKEWTSALQRIGLDPMLGYLHAPRAAKPALALDLMEEYRPIVADSVAIRLVNTGMIQARHAVRSHERCALTRKGRNAVLRAWEQRMQTEITHPVFGYRVSWRRLFEVQGRLFSRWLQGEIDEYPDLKLR